MRGRRIAFLLTGVTVVALLGAGPASPGLAAPADSGVLTHTVTDATQEWSPARMRDAVELAPAVTEAQRARSEHSPATLDSEQAGSVPSTPQPEGTISSLAFASSDARVGKVFLRLGATDYVCSASVINAPSRSVVLTAGHCLYDPDLGEWATSWVFVPGYANGSSPSGQFPASQLWTTTNWATYTDFDYDVGFATVFANGAGQHVQDAVGGLGLSWNQEALVGTQTRAMGYPSSAPFNGETQQGCSASSFWDSRDGFGTTSVGLVCNMTSGASGGPFVSGHRTGSETQYGLVSFSYVDDSERLYSPYFGGFVGDLYRDVNDVVPPRPPSAPSGVNAQAGNNLAVVAWRAPDSNGAPIEQYTVWTYNGANDALINTRHVTGTVATITGLNNGFPVRFRVTAMNAAGEGDRSVWSPTVTPSGPEVTRLSGATRYATSATISRETFSPGVPVAYVASGANFPDALSAGPAAGSLGGPVLLVKGNSVPGAIATELDRLDPQEIVVVGGTAAVSDDVVAALRQYAPVVQRISGANRYETAADVALATHPVGADVAYLASGTSFADALVAAPTARLDQAPILLTPGGFLHADTLAALQALGVGTVVIVGGTAAVSADVADALGSAGFEVERVAGASRYETAAAVASRTHASVPHVYLATGTNYPDALSGGAAAAYLGRPLLLTRTNCMPGPTVSLIDSLEPAGLTVLGGTAAVSNRSAQGAVCGLSALA